MKNSVIAGTDLKVLVSVEPIGGYHLADIDFTCSFFVYTNRSVEMHKEDMIKESDDSYVAVIDSEKLGLGSLKVKVVAQIPDKDCSDGYRQEVGIVSTGITIDRQ